ncbi:MAG: DUF350 domain-containing protein [Bdellovibrionota bacterium]
MDEILTLKGILSSVVYSVIGLVVLAAGFLIFDKATPSWDLSKEIVDKQNMAVAVVVAAVCLGISLIIASAIHG